MTNPLSTLRDTRDDTVAVLLADHLGGTLAYSPETGWQTWDGTLWRRDPDDSLAIKTVADWLRPLVHDEVDRLARAGARPSQLSPLLSLLGQNRHETLLRGLRGHLYVPVEAWDADPLLLCTPTGVVDLRDGSARPHDPADRMTRMTSVGYAKGATHDDWEQALRCQPDADTRRWMQWYLGGAVLGVQRDDRLLLMTGHGANGKSTVTGAVRAAMGTYGAIVTSSVLVGGAHSSSTARLVGVRYGVVEELDADHRLVMDKVKQLLGSEKATGRRLYKEEFEYDSVVTLAVCTNYRPAVSDVDHGTWRRLLRLDFGLRYGDEPDADAPVDKTLRRRLQRGKEQREAVLAWLVEGAMMAEPPMPLDMEAAREEWRMESDPLGQWLDDRCDFSDATAFTSWSLLLADFNEQREAAHEPKWGIKTFRSRLLAHHALPSTVTPTRTSGARGLQGVDLPVSTPF